MGINEYIQIGSTIKKIRKDRHISQKEMAEKLEIPYSTYSNYENNNREPKIETIEKIAKILDVPLAQLVGYEYYVTKKAQESCDILREAAKEITPSLIKLSKKIKKVDDIVTTFLNDPLIVNEINLDFDYNSLTSKELHKIEQSIFFAIQLKINEIINDRNSDNNA